MQPEHGTERSRKLVTEYMGDAGFTLPDGTPIPVSAGSHTYTQSERFCRNCGWVTCKGILGALLCPGECGEQW